MRPLIHLDTISYYQVALNESENVQLYLNILPCIKFLAISDNYGEDLANAVKYSSCLVRLPLYFELNITEQEYIIENVKLFFAH